MKILFIQLPLIDHGYGYIQGNIEYGPACIAAYIRKKFGSRAETRSVPFVLSNFGSDSVIVRYILNAGPDIVCFTSYLWNIERSLNIARQIKRSTSGIKIFAGGPEISAGSIAISEKRDEIDCFVCGEGEWFFDKYISGAAMDIFASNVNGNTLYTQPPDELLPAGEIVEPFSANMLDPMIDGSIFLELTRGCPYRCTYCYYSKNCGEVRELPFDILPGVLKHRKNLSEIYILSPAFSATRDFEKKLELLADVNPGVRLHSEMRASGIDRRKARLLYKAGFRSMEVGIQTLTSRSLEAVGRKSSPEKELDGMERMKAAGINLKIGVIPGLPFDTPGDFIRTIDRLVCLGFGWEIEFYPLMVLPGTAIRDRADRDGADYQKYPPYYYHGGWGFSFDDIVSVRQYVEAATGLTHSVKALPHFIFREDGILNAGVYFNGDDINSWSGEKYHDIIETSVFSFHVKISGTRAAFDGIPVLAAALPVSELYNIIFYYDDYIDQQKLIDILYGMERDNFTRRLNIFDDWDAGLRFRVYQVFSDPASFARCLEEYSIVTPVLRLDGTGSNIINNIDDDADVLVSKGSFGAVRAQLLARFAGRPGQVAFEDEAEQAEFYRLAGHEHDDMPFGFRVRR